MPNTFSGKAMRLGWWWLLVIPVAAFGLLELAGDWVFGVRTIPPPLPADIPPTEAREQARDAFSVGGGTGEAADPELVAALLAIGHAAKDGHASEVADTFDHNRLYDEITRSDLFAQSGLHLNPAAGPRRLRAALWDTAHQTATGFACDRVEVRKVVRLSAPGEFLVYARHRTGPRSTLYRWWMLHSSTGWKVFDVEDVRIGLRLSRQAVGQFIRGAEGDDPEKLVAGLQALPVAADRLAEGKLEEADAALALARAARLPREAFVLRCVLEGTLAVLRSRSTEALEWADRAEAVARGWPAIDYLRACAHGVAGKWAEAALHAGRYIDQTGPDAAACRILGTALRELNRPTEAAAAFEQGLQDDPTRDDLKAALRALRQP